MFSDCSSPPDLPVCKVCLSWDTTVSYNPFWFPSWGRAYWHTPQTTWYSLHGGRTHPLVPGSQVPTAGGDFTPAHIYSVKSSVLGTSSPYWCKSDEVLCLDEGLLSLSSVQDKSIAVKSSGRRGTNEYPGKRTKDVNILCWILGPWRVYIYFFLFITDNFLYGLM